MTAPNATDQTLIIELSSSKIGYGIYAPNGQLLNDKILGKTDTGKIKLSTKSAVQGDIETQDIIINRINDVKSIAQENGITNYSIIATSAFRDGEHASDAGLDFAKTIKHKTGLSVDILTGSEEAQYIAAAVFNDPSVTDKSTSSNLLIDMGGRSTEFIASDSQGNIQKVTSYPFGRLTSPSDADLIIQDAVNDFTRDIQSPKCIIYSGSLFRKSVSTFNDLAMDDNDHTLFRDFIKASSTDGTLARHIDFPPPSVQVANMLTDHIETMTSPETAITSAAKIPQGIIIQAPERLRPINSAYNPPPALSELTL